MPTDQNPPLIFSTQELDMLGRTADALSAYMGKPVLVEIIDADETGFEWALFAIALDIDDDETDMVTVQIGGVGARIIGNQGGLIITDDDVYQCQYMWAIQLSDIEGVRFIKVDDEGEEVAWSDDLSTMLPFALDNEPLPPDDELDEHLEDDDPGDDDLEDDLAPDPRTLH